MQCDTGMVFSSFPPTVLTVSGSRVRAKSPISAGSVRHPEDVFACAGAIVANCAGNVKRKNKKRCRKPAAHFICHRNQTARSTLLERRHLVQAYTWQEVPFTTAFTRLTFGFHARLERLWEWETLIPKVTPLPQKSHFAIHRTSHPNGYFRTSPIRALRYDIRLFPKKQAFFCNFFGFLKTG